MCEEETLQMSCLIASWCNMKHFRTILYPIITGMLVNFKLIFILSYFLHAHISVEKVINSQRIRRACPFFISRTRTSFAYASYQGFQFHNIGYMLPFNFIYMYYRHYNTLKIK